MATRPQIAAIVLAAGSSRRFGAANKLLAGIDGVPLVARVVARVAESRGENGVADIVVVTGHEREAVAAALEGLAVCLVHNPRHGEGIGTSIAAGIAALGSEVEAALICLADMPETDPALIHQLIAAFAAAASFGAAPIIVPTTGSDRRQGNPVLWPRRHFAALSNLSGDQGAKALIAADAAHVVRIVSDGAAAAIDLDTPEALAAYIAARGTGGRASR